VFFLLIIKQEIKKRKIRDEGEITMRLTPQVTLKDIPHSEAVEAKIREKVTKLERFHSRIMGCRVAVESPQRRQHQGKLYTVRIDITVPGEEIVINRMENEDLYVAIRDAFDAANRKLEEQERRQRGDVKAHVEPPRGRVAKIYPDKDHGFIETNDGREIYFHRNSLIDLDFDRLKEGAEVVFLEEQGEKGPQAFRVAVK
jgi:ribosomal subunit interface protein